MEILQTALSTLTGIIASFLMFWGSFLPATQLHTAPAPAPTVSKTPSTTFPQSKASATTTSAAKPAQKVVPPKPVIPVPPLPPAKSQEQINIDTRAALINILCMPQTGFTSGISGSGIIVDSRGVILTNAHVAQFFLLRDYLTVGNMDCVVRTGSPAQAQYTATLLYLPPVWVVANASQIKASQATGTGENDYAFLLITGRTNPAATLPESFARLEMDRAYVDTGEPMLLAAYPAGFLGGETVEKSLYASSAIAYVTQLFTFGDAKKIDLFSIGGTVVSQGGSSGGAAVRLSNGTLAGIITTETTAASTGERDLRAISLSHIDDSLTASGKGGVVGLLSGDLSAKAADFNKNVAPSETAQLEAVLKGN